MFCYKITKITPFFAHLEFQQDEAGTKAMFARERRSRERYNCCVAEDAAMPVGSFFNEES